MFRRRTIPHLLIEQLDDAGDGIWTVLGHSDHGRPVLVPVFDVVDRIAERAGGALLDGVDDLLGYRAVGIDPGVFSQFEGRLQVVGAVTGVRTNATIIVNRDVLSGIGFP